MKKLLSILLVLISVLFLFGCTGSGVNICGDGICSPGEENTCLIDCAEPVLAKVNVYISGAYDSSEDLVLYWHHNKDVYANVSSNMTSRLGDNWYGSENKNLYLGFNDSKSGSIPVTSWEDRAIELNFTEQGDYYFEARSNDWGYRAVSDKITINKDGEYNVNLNIVASNPALRVRGYDEQWNLLRGPATVRVYSVSEYYDKYGTGDWVQDEWEVQSYYFGKNDEINALFWLWPTGYDIQSERNNYFKVVVEKEEYGSGFLNYVHFNQKYTEMGAIVYKDEPVVKNGELKISIVPGFGTTENDVLKLNGQTATICGNGCYSTTIKSKTAHFESVPEGKYYLNQVDYNSQSLEVPVGLDVSKSIKVVGETTNYAEVKGLLGMTLSLRIIDSSNKIIPSSEINLIKFCQVYNGEEYCYEYNGQSWYVENPYVYSMLFYSEDEAMNYPRSNQLYKYTLEYLGVQKTFDLVYKQGYNENIWQFSPTNIDHNYVEAVELGRSIYVDGGRDYRGKIMEIKFLDVIQTAYNENYHGKFGLYDAGILIKIIQKAPSFDLRDEFGTMLVKTSAVVESVGLRLEDEKYVATIRVE